MIAAERAAQIERDIMIGLSCAKGRNMHPRVHSRFDAERNENSFVVLCANMNFNVVEPIDPIDDDRYLRWVADVVRSILRELGS